MLFYYVLFSQFFFRKPFANRTSTMTTLLQTYEEEYKESVRKINEELTSLRDTLKRDAPSYKAPPSTGVGSRVQRCTHLTSLIKQLKELLTNMEYECNDIPPANRQVAKERVSGYRNTCRQLEEDITKIKTEASAADRQDLIGEQRRTSKAGEEGGADDGDPSRQHRLQMMDNTAKVKEASNTLKKSERLLNETEEIGSQALTTLRTQTEQMNRINETTIAVDEEISEAHRVLNGMRKVMVKHKLILICIILLLVFLIVLSVYLGLSKRNKTVVITPTQTPVDPIPPTDVV
ncbi:vesicle transport through interaction with t-SNARE 1 [Angomonas deanei]|uniref:Vesicle transport v-SNARE protein N-terminus/Snare region anchored in the vesicle membrane C-terminus, putative n=1 Tax=Angomonas deanei TaxID=59799 RepID=A0A7G2CLT1_9TRYP|nr:vesicle transport through interaction with t-SNARE 1 [Angomonas deanei]CAD2220808.1 Vesicle transport v-SNARE protein N-terminus/Snare region anchored in the vesicle membrane C-terminus, putative [Angomonas deanei]|eukprot:EPY41221.1 vesicle transport through interaction with t-SNARE 1 [Angomonas deanei]